MEDLNKLLKTLKRKQKKAREEYEDAMNQIVNLDEIKEEYGYDEDGEYEDGYISQYEDGFWIDSRALPVFNDGGEAIRFDNSRKKWDLYTSLVTKVERSIKGEDPFSNYLQIAEEYKFEKKEARKIIKDQEKLIKEYDDAKQILKKLEKYGSNKK